MRNLPEHFYSGCSILICGRRFRESEQSDALPYSEIIPKYSEQITAKKKFRENSAISATEGIRGDSPLPIPREQYSLQFQLNSLVLIKLCGPIIRLGDRYGYGARERVA